MSSRKTFFIFSFQSDDEARKKEILSVSLKIINYWSLQDLGTWKQAWKYNWKRNILQASLSKFSHRYYITFPGSPAVWEAGILGFLVCGVIPKAEVGGRGQRRAKPWPCSMNPEPPGKSRKCLSLTERPDGVCSWETGDVLSPWLLSCIFKVNIMYIW